MYLTNLLKSILPEATSSPLRTALLLACLLAGFSVRASTNSGSEEIHELNPFEVTGTRLASSAPRPVGGWLVRGFDDPDRPQLLDTWTLLESVPGIHIEQPGGSAGNASLYLRGGEPNFTKVLVDGIEVNNPNSSRGGTYNFSALNLAGIAEIAVLGGAQSAIYGSDALSGVIDIRTAGTELPEPGRSFTLEAQGGELDTVMAGARASIGDRSRRFTAGASRLEESNAFTGESFAAWRWNGSLVHQLASGLRMHFSVIGSDIARRHYPDDSGGWRYAEQHVLDYVQSRDHGAQANVQLPVGPATELVGRLSWYRFEEQADSPGVLPGERDPFGIPPNAFDSLLDRRKAQAYLRHAFASGLGLVVGMELLDEEGSSDSRVVYPFGEMEGRYALETRTESLFVESSFAPLDGHLANLAVRWDDIDGIARVRTRRAAYQADIPGTALRLRLLYGEGFKKPSFFALANPIVGNPHLDPEESDIWEASIDWEPAGKKFTLRLSVFEQEFSNLIDLSEEAPPRMVNLQSVSSKGSTAAFVFRHGKRFSLVLHAALVDLETDEPDVLLRQRPEWRFGLDAELRLFKRGRLDLRTVYVGERMDSSIPTGTRELEAYVRTDLGLRWLVSEGLWAGIWVDNLWNKAYESVIGMPDPGHRFRAGTRWSF